ncbi:MAG: hypothetical protein NC489_40675 [Ruminococcus flavefaciens]|nr:hypothetical protein [Ruminococcus flavefaciens]
MKDIIGSISTIKNFMANASRTTCNEYLYESLQDAVECMERYIPKKIVDDKEFGTCPCCHYEFNSELINEYKLRHCPRCGQALD